MKFNLKLVFATFFAISAIISCTKKEDVGATATSKMAGEWYIEYFDASDPTVALDHHTKIKTYNTSTDDGKQVWVDDQDWWPFKAKFDVNATNLTFSAMPQTQDVLALNRSTPKVAYIRVVEGKVLSGMGKSKSGNKVDSIYLKVEFTTDDPGKIYEIRGHQRTGFFEDEY